MFELLAIGEQNERFSKAMDLIRKAFEEANGQLQDLRGRVEQLEKEREHGH